MKLTDEQLEYYGLAFEHVKKAADMTFIQFINAVENDDIRVSFYSNSREQSA
ncbi:hypothetical protein D3C76_479210 [compost metagenome]